jgi:hypothetical protein
LGEVAGDRSRILGLVDRILDFGAERRFAILAEQELAHSAPQSRAAVVLVPSRHQSATS